MSLSIETVRYVAKLSALAITDEEAQRMCKDLGETLDYVAKLAEISTEGVRPTSHVHGATNDFREDILKPSFKTEEVSSIAPDFGPSGFRVPRII